MQIFKNIDPKKTSFFFNWKFDLLFLCHPVLYESVRKPYQNTPQMGHLYYGLGWLKPAWGLTPHVNNIVIDDKTYIKDV